MILLKDRNVHVILKLRSGWISCRFDFFCLFCLFFFSNSFFFFPFFSFAFLFFLLVSFFFLLLLQRFLSKKRLSKIHAYEFMLRLPLRAPFTLNKKYSISNQKVLLSIKSDWKRAGVKNNRDRFLRRSKSKGMIFGYSFNIFRTLFSMSQTRDALPCCVSGSVSPRVPQSGVSICKSMFD